MSKLASIRKIAVLRANAFGDFIAATPALHALRDAYPDAEIFYLGRPWHKEFLEARPSPVDRVIVIPVCRGVRWERDDVEDLAALEAFFQRVPDEHFDLAIQMHGGGRHSNPFVKRLGARVTLGLKAPDAEALDIWLPYVYDQNEFIRLLELVSLVGATSCDYEPRITIIDRDRQEVRSRLPQLSPPFVALHPGAGDVRRRWPADRFARVGDALAEQGYQIVVTGTGAEKPVVDSVLTHMRHPALSAYDLLTIGGLAGLFERASLVISNDSGPLHFAGASGAPTIGLFWCGNMGNWAHLGRTTHRPLPSWIVHCPLCGVDMNSPAARASECGHQVSFVDGVSVDQVLVAADDLLAYPDVVALRAPSRLMPPSRG